MEKPYVYALSRIEWQLFVSLTFVRERMPASLCRLYWFGWVRAVCRVYGVHFKRCLWFLRSEFGEVGGRYHYHALLGGLPIHGLNDHANLRLMRLWEQQKPLVNRKAEDGKYRMLSKCCGCARVRLYNPALDALDYSDLDGLDGQFGQRALSSTHSLSGANAYEAGKFGKAESVEVSESVVRVVNNWRNRRPAKRIEDGQREVSATYQSQLARFLGTPALPSTSPAITERTSVNQLVGSSHPIRGVNTSWRETGPGIFTLADA